MTIEEIKRDAPIHVLLVDDDEDDFFLTSELLAAIPGGKYQIEWIMDFEGALEALCSGRFDVCLVDHYLGARTGLEILAASRRRKCSTPIILLTGWAAADIDQAASEAGAADFLEKSRLDEVTLDRSIRYTLRQHRQELELEKKVQERTEELAQANASLRQTDQRKDEFLATLAHELRNPLAPIRNALHILRIAPPNTPSHEQARLIIERQTNTLVRLIDDLMDVSRITRDKLQLNLESVEISEVVSLAIEASRPLFEKANLSFDSQLPSESIKVLGDRIRLAQVVTNILNNSAKYTEKGSVVLVVEKRNAHVHIRIVDTGIGISVELLPRIFEWFTQADSTRSRSQGGLGIGLALAKRLVELHHGDIRVVSEGCECGTEFTITLPLARNNEENLIHTC